MSIADLGKTSFTLAAAVLIGVAQCAGVLQNEGQLRGFLEEHIVQPLAAQATPAPPRASSPVPAAPATADGDVAAPGEPSYTAILSCTCVWVRLPGLCSEGLHRPMCLQCFGMLATESAPVDVLRRQRHRGGLQRYRAPRQRTAWRPGAACRTGVHHGGAGGGGCGLYSVVP